MSHRNRVQEEDVDDLDDIVEQFDANLAPDSRPPEATSSSSTLPPSSSKSDHESGPSGAGASGLESSGPLPDELTKQLAEGMESLMRELAETSNGSVTEEEKKRREAWEKMLIDGMNDMSMDDILGRESRDKPGQSSKSTPDRSANDFQASILQAMEKLKDSDSTLHTNATSATAVSDDPLEALLNQLNTGLDDSGEDNGDLQEMLETMMQQLMSKEVLYEPLKELHEKFPVYLSENNQKLSSEDKSRFLNQMTRVSTIVKIFEDPAYKEDDQEKGAQIVTLMNEMQSFGSPPSEIMGPLPPGFELGPEGAPKLPDGCTVM